MICLGILAGDIFKLRLLAFLGGFHRVVLHSLFKSRESLFLIALSKEVWFNSIIMANSVFSVK